MSSVFISYKTDRDSTLANVVRHQLEALGLTVFQDVDLPAGPNAYPIDLDQNLLSAKAILVLWTRHSVGSSWVIAEAAKALERQVLLSATFGIRQGDLKLPFNGIQAPDLSDWLETDLKTKHYGWKSILTGLSKLTGRPSLLDLAAAIECGTQQAKRKFIAKYPHDDFARKFSDELKSIEMFDQKVAQLKVLFTSRLDSGALEPSAVKNLDPVSLFEAMTRDKNSVIHVPRVPNDAKTPIPIYFDQEARIDWLKQFQIAMNQRFPSFDSRMLYLAPGGAALWRQMTSGARRTRAYSDLTRAFLDKYKRVVNDLDLQSPNLNIIDLGPGDFGKGKLILEHYLNQNDIQEIHYYPLDASYDMLSQGLNSQDDVLGRVFERGRIEGIHSSFSSLQRHKHLISSEGANIFLLLGNTLGNEISENETLRDIASGMNPGDVLVAELQLIEPIPDSAEHLTRSIQAAKHFYASPFIAVGYDVNDIDLFVKSELGIRESAGVRYNVYCRLRKYRELSHPLLEANLTIPATDVLVYVVRKYDETEIKALFGEAGLEVKRQESTSWHQKGDRIFHYVTARKAAKAG